LAADARYDGFDPEWSSYREAQAYLMAGQVDRFMEICANFADQPGPGHILGRCGLLMALTMAGRDEEARAIAEDTVAAARAHCNPYCIAVALYASGRAFAQADSERARRVMGDGLVYAQEHRLSLLVSAIAQEAAGLEAIYGDLGQALALFDTALDSLQGTGNVTSVGATLAILAVCFDRFDRPDVAATLYGAGRPNFPRLYLFYLPAVVDHLRTALGDAAFDQCAATGANMDLAEAVGYARHHIELARRQTANPDCGGT
jgi:hypothetical protein